jgi:hypothetical protein
MTEASTSRSAHKEDQHITEGKSTSSFSSLFSTKRQRSASRASPILSTLPDEAAVYDRQIRLWGLEAQNRYACSLLIGLPTRNSAHPVVAPWFVRVRMRGSTILIINLRSLAAETIKNLVLAGIGKLIVRTLIAKERVKEVSDQRAKEMTES